MTSDRSQFPTPATEAGSGATNSLLVLDASTPWIWNMFTALPQDWRAVHCGPVSVGFSPRRWHRAKAAGHVPVPGWTRFFRISTVLLARQVESRVRQHVPRAIVHVIPWTAGLLDRFPTVPHVYRPHDFFGMYSWNQKRVRELEASLVARCRFIAPNTEAQAEDFRKQQGAPVRVLPMAVSAEFIQKMRGPNPPRPDDLPRSQPIVGCIGQITLSYDFDYCSTLVDAVPEAMFVFIGPILDDSAELHRRAHALFERPNVVWLGPKAHEQLPNYLSHFDVCFCPLQATMSNDRRSPLRLFDYLASGKPVISTNVAAARGHAPHVEVCATPVEAATRLHFLLASNSDIDDAARKSYVDLNTWDQRAKQFIAMVEEFCH